ncbi:MAG: FIG00356038: hypothetical protein, partial [uncultured Quadrisphaera sp.]
ERRRAQRPGHRDPGAAPRGPARGAHHLPAGRRREHRRHPRAQRARPPARAGGAPPLGQGAHLRPHRVRPAGQGAVLPQRHLRVDAHGLRAGPAGDRVPPDPAGRRLGGEGRRHRHPAHAGGDRGARRRHPAGQPRRRLPRRRRAAARRARSRRRGPAGRAGGLPGVRQQPLRRAVDPGRRRPLQRDHRPEAVRPRGRRGRVHRGAAAGAGDPAGELRPRALPL